MYLTLLESLLKHAEIQLQGALQLPHVNISRTASHRNPKLFTKYETNRSLAGAVINTFTFQLVKPQCQEGDFFSPLSLSNLSDPAHSLLSFSVGKKKSLSSFLKKKKSQKNNKLLSIFPLAKFVIISGNSSWDYGDENYFRFLFSNCFKITHQLKVLVWPKASGRTPNFMKFCPKGVLKLTHVLNISRIN